MGNEPDGAGTKDNLEVIRELLRRLEEAAQSRSLASSDRPQNANRELASLRQRAPPTRLAPSPPPGSGGYYSPLEALPVDPVARWRLPIAAIAGYALGVATTLVTVAYHDRVTRFAAEMFAFGQPQTATKKVALGQPSLGQARPETTPAKEAPPPRPITASQAPAAATAATGSDMPPPPGPQSRTPQPSVAPQQPAEPITAPQSATAKAPAPGKTPPAPAEKANPAIETVARADPGTAATRAGAGPLSVALKLAPQIEVRGGERARFPVGLEPSPSDSDALLLVMRGVPEEIALSQGSAIGNEIWLIPAHMVRGLEFTVAGPLIGTFDVSAELVTLDGRLLAQARTRIVAMPTVLATPVPPGPAAIEKLDAETIRRLTARGELLLDTGDIGAARLVLERAAEAGSAIAALRLGETYDPVLLQRTGAQLDSGDEAQALRWYERAERLGSPRAAERLGELRKR